MQPFRILSYNVRYFGHATRGLASTRAALDRIAGAIASLDPLPSVVCLQEVETSSIRSTVAHPGKGRQIDRFTDALRAALDERGRSDAYEALYYPAHAYRIARGTHAYTTGLAILLHDAVEIEEHNVRAPHDITYRRGPAHGLKQTRICAHARVRVKADKHRVPIDVFNTHLSLPTALAREFWTAKRRLGWGANQMREADNLAKFVETRRSSDRFVVVGDFNALPGSPVYERLRAQAGWADAFAERNKWSTEALIAFPTAGFVRMRMHLDHVFGGRGLTWEDFDGTRPFGDRASAFHGLSDHVPLVGRCRPG